MTGTPPWHAEARRSKRRRCPFTRRAAPPRRGMEIFRPARALRRSRRSAIAVRREWHGQRSLSGTASRLFDLDEPNRAGLGARAFWQASARQCRERRIAGADARAAWRCVFPKAQVIADRPETGFRRRRVMCAALLVLEDGASLTLLESMSAMRETSPMSAWKSCWARMRGWIMFACRPSRRRRAGRGSRRCTSARDAVYRAPFRQLRRQAVAPRTGDRAWMGRAPRRICPVCQRAVRATPCRHDHPCRSCRRPTRSSTPAVQEGRGRQGARRLSGQGHRARRAPTVRQPSDRQGAAAGRPRRSRPQARTGNLRRRCDMRPWRGGRRSGCGFAVLSARPRHSGSRSAASAVRAFLEDAVAEIADDRSMRDAGARRMPCCTALEGDAA